MIAHPTHILRITRCGSRRAGAWLNQPSARRKVEPNRRKDVGLDILSKGEPATKAPSPPRAVLDASPLLVILHYLLKNNTTFMVWNVQVKMSPRQPSVTTFQLGGI